MSVRQIVDRRRRLRRVLNHMQANLFEKITLAELAEAACLSKFHFERFYAEALGETPLVTVRRLRLAHAQELLQSGANVTTAAFQCGYGSPQTFARAFSRAYGVAPSMFRMHTLEPRYPVRITDLPSRRVYQIPFVEFGADRAATFDHLLATVEQRGIERSGWTVWSQIDAGLSDPASIAGIERLDGIAPLRGIDQGTIGGGLHAVIRWRGEHKPQTHELHNLAQSATGLRVVKERVLCHWINDPVFTAPHDRLSDYYLRLE
jgi:AraC-like DNA-binding protein